MNLLHLLFLLLLRHKTINVGLLKRESLRHRHSKRQRYRGGSSRGSDTSGTGGCQKSGRESSGGGDGNGGGGGSTGVVMVSAALEEVETEAKAAFR